MSGSICITMQLSELTLHLSCIRRGQRSKRFICIMSDVVNGDDSHIVVGNSRVNFSPDVLHVAILAAHLMYDFKHTSLTTS